MKTQLKKDEKVILVTWPHWFTLGGPFLILLIGLATGILIAGYALIVSAVTVLYFIYEIVKRKNNLWAVTNLRVIDEYGVFSNNAKESPLDKINNVSYHQSFWGKIFGFGNVQIQTAAEIGSTTYVAVEHPKQLKDTITRMQEEYKQQQIKNQAAGLANAILEGQKNNHTGVADELEKLYQLQQKGVITVEEFQARKAKILNS